jgi:predicted enzyme related to lactoylglutathione lyase
MQVVKQYPDGVFSWIDLGTTDTEGAKAFYGGLFGWTFQDIPTDSSTIYSMAQIDGYDVAGIGPLDSGMQEQGVPPNWIAYVKHDDVDAVAVKAAEAGGTVLFPPFDVMDSGRMTMIQDPTGAVFGVWQPKQHIGAKLVNIPNTLVWNELQTNDLDAARAFYAAVFGWTYQVDASGYVVCNVDDRSQAGMMAIQEDWGPVPPNWTSYILVSDIKASAAKVSELGGTLLAPPTSAGEVGTFALAHDPQGGHFTMIEYAGPAASPPGY